MNKPFIWMILLLMLCAKIYAQGIVLKDIKGSAVTVPLKAEKVAKVFFFLSPECPLCQSYSLTIRNLYAQYHKQGVEMVGIIPGTDFSTAIIAEYKTKYKMPIQLLRDEQLVFVKQYKVTITPEVVMIDVKGKVQYQGRIDNWAYELGKKRTVITEHNLEDAIKSLLNNQPVKVARTKAVGCYIE